MDLLSCQMSAVWGSSQSDVLLASSSPPVVTNPSDICPRRFVHLASSLCALHTAAGGVAGVYEAGYVPGCGVLSWFTSMK